MSLLMSAKILTIFVQRQTLHKFCSECHYIDYQVVTFTTKNSDHHYLKVVSIVADNLLLIFHCVCILCYLWCMMQYIHVKG